MDRPMNCGRRPDVLHTLGFLRFTRLRKLIHKIWLQVSSYISDLRKPISQSGERDVPAHFVERR